MPDLVTVFHGTSHAFEAEIEDHGLRVRPGLSRGVRIAVRQELALAHAAAYAAYMMLTEALPPKVIVAKARIEQSRIREGAAVNPLAEFEIGGVPITGPALTVPDGIRREEITLEKTELKFLFDARAGKRAIEMYERLTDKKVTLIPGRPGGRGRMRR